jgi:hypothetical protein
LFVRPLSVQCPALPVDPAFFGQRHRAIAAALSS